MSDYTPTTEDVLDAMKNGWFIAEDAMNRWLAEVKAHERERIIKLLESKITCDWKQEHCEACDQTDYLVALIKGENK